MVTEVFFNRGDLDGMGYFCQLVIGSVRITVIFCIKFWKEWTWHGDTMRGSYFRHGNTLNEYRADRAMTNGPVRLS